MGITSRPGFVSPGTQYRPTPMASSYSVPIGVAQPNRPVKPPYVAPEYTAVMPPMGGQGEISESKFTIPDNFFGFLMLIGGL